MAVYTEESVKANIRNRDGKRVFYLEDGNHLTPSAREWLRRERIEVIAGIAPVKPEFETISGAKLTEKPEHMTHLRSGILVPKDHPRIRFRGAIDSLEAELLLTGRFAMMGGDAAAAKQLEELLEQVRRIIRCDVLEEPIQVKQLCGLTMEQLREQSHHPEKYFDQPHFMPAATDSELLLRFNRLRTVIRQTELLACEAFQDRDGRVTRPDIIQLLNRMSSMLWIMVIKRKKEETHGRQTGASNRTGV